ncbi:MAG: hypothetical protein J2P50_08675 [Hyphomicrobiaceae bacterium]|nr:hypothetical protein [Hyphomicrobiaceae bacterium]
MLSGRLPLPLLALAALAALAAGPTKVRAAPLDAETCTKLQGEQERLENAGVEKDLAKGPVWAKANLAPDKLGLVQRFIEIEEQLLFRCRNKAIVHLPPESEAPESAEDKDDDDKDTAGKGPAGKGGVEGQTPKKAAAAAKPAKGAGGWKKAPAKSAAHPELSAAPGVTEIAKRPAKVKVEDAYKIPPPDPDVNPFADQLKLPAD